MVMKPVASAKREARSRCCLTCRLKSGAALLRNARGKIELSAGGREFYTGVVSGK